MEPLHLGVLASDGSRGAVQVDRLEAPIAGHDGRRSDTERVRRRSRLECHRLYLLSLVFSLVGVTALTVLESAPALALAGFAAVKTLLDLRYRSVADGPL